MNTTGTKTAHETSDGFAYAPPEEHKTNTGSNESSEHTNNSTNANLGCHCGDNGSPIRSGHDIRGRIAQGNNLQKGRNGQNIKGRHKKHLT